MKSFFTSFIRRAFTSKGMAMAEVMVAAGILGGISLAVVKMNQNAAMGVKNVEQKNDLEELKGQIRIVLGKNMACKYTMQNPSAVTVTNATSTRSTIYDYTNGSYAAKWVAGTTYGGWKFNTITFYGNSGWSGTNSAETSLKIVLENVKVTSANQKAIGDRFKTITVPIYVSYAGGAVTDCAASAGGAAQGLSIWTYGSNAGEVYYQAAGNKVGIGTSSPAEVLDVTGGNILIDAGYGYKIGSQTALTMDTNNNLSLNGNMITQSGGSNTAVGKSALSANTSGYSNTAVGFESMLTNTSGHENTAFGRISLREVTTGSFNTAIGYESLRYNSTGNENTAVGLQSLVFNTSGGSNVAVGNNAMRINTTGTGNTALGWQAMYLNESANYNTATGFRSMYKNTTGSGNVATGFEALYLNVTGAGNTAMGYEALFNNVTSNNTGFGYQALRAATSGANNTAVGYAALNQ